MAAAFEVTRTVVGQRTLGRLVAKRVDVVFLCLRVEEILELDELVRVLGREVDGLTEVVGDPVELPSLVAVAKWQSLAADPWHPTVEAAGNPAVVIDRPIAEDLEVLDDVRAQSIGVAEAVAHGDALDRLLLDAVDVGRLSDPGRLVDSRHKVDDVVELGAQLAARSQVRRPRDREAVTGAAEVRCDLLHPLERRVERPRPGGIEVVLATRGAEVVDVFEEPLRILGKAVLEGRRAPHPVQRAFGGGPVVAGHVDKQRVVPDAESL